MIPVFCLLQYTDFSGLIATTHVRLKSLLSFLLRQKDCFVFLFLLSYTFLLFCCVLRRTQSLKHIDTTCGESGECEFQSFLFLCAKTLDICLQAFESLSWVVKIFCLVLIKKIGAWTPEKKRTGSAEKKCNHKKVWLHTKARLNHNTQIIASSLRFCLPRLLYVLNPGSRRRKKKEIRNKTSDVWWRNCVVVVHCHKWKNHLLPSNRTAKEKNF